MLIMIKRTLYFENPCYLKKKNKQLVIEYPDNEKEMRTIPVEDIGMLVLDCQQITLSHGLIVELMDNNAAVLSCNTKHMPYGLMLPMASHHAFTEKLYAQLESSVPLRKNMWQQTVIAKILNQAALLEQQGIDTTNMKYWAGKVKSGDPDNYEARAAAYYWDNLFQIYDGFRRHRFGDAPNNLLNYGYAILRAIVARALTGSGLFTALGIHHKNKYNPYCLADDIMEPYRPYTDKLVLELLEDNDEIDELTTPLKTHLLSIATVDILIENQTSPLMVGVQRTGASVRKCFEGETRKLIYPEM
jgi:CRISPR-associated protein Cas1